MEYQVLLFKNQGFTSQRINPPIGMVGTAQVKRSVADYIFTLYKLSINEIPTKTGREILKQRAGW